MICGPQHHLLGRGGSGTLTIARFYLFAQMQWHRYDKEGKKYCIGSWAACSQREYCGLILFFFFFLESAIFICLFRKVLWIFLILKYDMTPAEYSMTAGCAIPLSRQADYAIGLCKTENPKLSLIGVFCHTGWVVNSNERSRIRNISMFQTSLQKTGSLL